MSSSGGKNEKLEIIKVGKEDLGIMKQLDAEYMCKCPFFFFEQNSE